MPPLARGGRFALHSIISHHHETLPIVRNPRFSLIVFVLLVVYVLQKPSASAETLAFPSRIRPIGRICPPKKHRHLPRPSLFPLVFILLVV